VIIYEYAVTTGEFTRKDLLNDRAWLKLTPRQASYRLNALVKDGGLILKGRGRSARYIIADRPRGITYTMNLNPEPFDAIKYGRKTVEMRLNDERRKYINEGDYILFTNTGSKEELLVEVMGRQEYPSFYELYADHNKTAIGYTEDETADPRDMLEYYTEEKIKKYGALAITVKLVKTDDVNT
jgi:ASC-1-like (ASCH) protein